MPFFQQETPQQKIENTDKPKYESIKKCVLKRESGDYSEECKQIMKKLGVED